MTLFNKHDQGLEPPKHLKGDRPFDRDRFHMVSRNGAAAAATLAYFQLQDIKSPEEQFAGVAILFATMCLKTGYDPKDAEHFGRRVLFAEGEYARDVSSADLQALRDMLGWRVMAKEGTIG